LDGQPLRLEKRRCYLDVVLALAQQGVAADERRRSASGLPLALAAEPRYVSQTVGDAMPKILIEDYDPVRHPNPMQYVDSAQAKRRERGGKLVPYRVCIVRVADFEFLFHSTVQLELCLEYYRLEHLPSTRLPVHTGNFGGDHWETQRWFERLPGRLRAEGIRQKVIAVLETALETYSREPGAVTGAPKPKLFDSY
jgi:hypothetical protein